MLAIALAVALAPAAVIAQNAATAAGKARVQVDSNRDGFIDRAEAANKPRLLARFDQMDTNKDGRLGADEHPKTRMRHKRGGHRQWFQRADADKDGRISRAEAQVLQSKAGGRFDKMDLNKDGFVDRADMQARMTKARAVFFAGADSNKDGRVSRDEFVVETGARGADRREKWAKRASAIGKQATARPAPSMEQQIQRATARFERMDGNKDGSLTRAEFDVAKASRKGAGGNGR